jgi:hypothetical protein
MSGAVEVVVTDHAVARYLEKFHPTKPAGTIRAGFVYAVQHGPFWGPREDGTYLCAKREDNAWRAVVRLEAGKAVVLTVIPTSNSYWRRVIQPAVWRMARGLPARPARSEVSK